MGRVTFYFIRIFHFYGNTTYCTITLNVVGYRMDLCPTKCFWNKMNDFSYTNPHSILQTWQYYKTISSYVTNILAKMGYMIWPQWSCNITSFSYSLWKFHKFGNKFKNYNLCFSIFFEEVSNSKLGTFIYNMKMNPCMYCWA